MLFRKIKEDAVLAKIICERCEDEGIGVDIDPSIVSDDVLILKVDDFYNSLNIEKKTAFTRLFHPYSVQKRRIQANNC